LKETRMDTIMTLLAPMAVLLLLVPVAGQRGPSDK